MYKIKIILEAKEDLFKELAYSKRNWGIQHSRKYSKNLRANIKELCINPHLFRIRDDILPNIRIKVYKGNKIFFTVHENKKMVIVLAIVGSRLEMDYKKLKQRRRNI